MSRCLAVRIAVSLLVAAGIAAVAAPGGSAQTQGPRTITLVETNRGSTNTYVDNARHGTSAGDTVALTFPLTDPAAGGARVGTASAICTMTRTKRSGEPPLICQGVFALKDGDIAVSGRLSPGVDHLAVVGGTGAYAGARGTMDSTDTRTGSTDVFTLLP